MKLSLGVTFLTEVSRPKDAVSMHHNGILQCSPRRNKHRPDLELSHRDDRTMFGITLDSAC